LIAVGPLAIEEKGRKKVFPKNKNAFDGILTPKGEGGQRKRPKKTEWKDSQGRKVKYRLGEGIKGKGELNPDIPTKRLQKETKSPLKGEGEDLNDNQGRENRIRQIQLQGAGEEETWNPMKNSFDEDV